MIQHLCDRCLAPIPGLTPAPAKGIAVTIPMAAGVDAAGTLPTSDFGTAVTITSPNDLCDTCRWGALAAMVAAMPSVSDAAKQTAATLAATPIAVQPPPLVKPVSLG